MHRLDASVRIVASFNPHPASLPGDAIALVNNAAVDTGFNPHPASLPGDAVQALDFGQLGIRFNPHPASLPGDASVVSIFSILISFQSAPGIAAG